MERLFQLFASNTFVWEYLIAICVFLLPLRKRSHFLPRLLLGAAGVILINVLGNGLIALGMPRMFGLFLTWGAGVGLFLLCAPLTFWDGFYGGVCAYAAQHMYYALYSFLERWLPGGNPVLPWQHLTVFAAVVVLCYFVFSRNMVLDGRYQITPSGAIGAAVIVFPFAFYLNMAAEDYYQLDGNLPLLMICRLYAILCCVFVLFIQTGIHKKMYVQNELNTRSLLWEQRRAQYELSSETIDLINRKCHDLKHQVAALRSIRSQEQRDRHLDELERSVMIYDSVLKTGNEVLDTILTEKSLLCEREGITWTCLVDGSALDFMDPVDLYTLFGNALDNAVESVRKLEQAEQRVISLTQHSKPGMTVIQIENYYAGTLSFQNGLPETSKGDTLNHGHGMKSIREITEKYGGCVSVRAQEQVFLLSLLFPLSEATK